MHAAMRPIYRDKPSPIYHRTPSLQLLEFDPESFSNLALLAQDTFPMSTHTPDLRLEISEFMALFSESPALSMTQMEADKSQSNPGPSEVGYLNDWNGSSGIYVRLALLSTVILPAS